MTFFDFGEKNTATLFNFLQDALAKNNEFEIRFGKFYRNNNNNNSNKGNQKGGNMSFDSSVDIETFYGLKQMFDAQNVDKNIKRTREFVYNDENVSIKRIVDLDNNSVKTMSKQTFRKYDVYDYDLRMSVAREIEDVDFDESRQCTIVRTKNRTSYIVPFGTLDMTIVTQTNNKNEIKNDQIKFEVELEIRKFNKDMIMKYIMVILQNCQGNFFVIPGNERRRVMFEYRTLVKSNYFVGAQPETLHKERIHTLYKTDYSVTDKADGDRAFMILDKAGSVYFVDNNMNKTFRTDVVCSNSYISTVVDGELVRHDNKICFLAFDILVYNGTDLRGDTRYCLRSRLEILQNVVSSLSESDYYSITVKHYYFGNVFGGSKTILDTVDEKFYKNDGLIFTPANEPYPVVKKWSGLLKWKPAELNTIDFFVKKVEDNRWLLYVQGERIRDHSDDYKGKMSTQTVLFDIEKLCGGIDNENRVVTYETTFGDDLLDPTTGEKYKTETVIEFRWDKVENKFVPLRTRWDKTVNPSKHGNYYKVACDIWNNINNPVERDYLLKFYSGSKGQSEKDVFFERMRRFHNKVKEYLYGKYCRNIDKLLELCSGRGGDIHKWMSNNVKTVTGYDVSERNIAECKRRSESSRCPDSYRFYKLDLTRSDTAEIVYKNEMFHKELDGSSVNVTKFDVVCCQFGIHYFFESIDSLDNIIRILETSLKIGGYFVVTFMDNKCLSDLFDNKDTVCYEQEGEIMYTLERQMTSGYYGNRLKISLNGNSNNILSEGSDEWIINFGDFCKRMQERGFDCVETQLFSDLYKSGKFGDDLTDCERQVSFLNRYCVFMRNTDSLDNVIVGNNMIFSQGVDTEYNFETIDLHQHDISVYRITSVYNIVDAINCIEYRYYKNNIENKSLDEIPERIFPEIERLFSDLKIVYKPVFISDPLDFSQYRDSKNNVYFTYHKHVVEKKTDSTNTNTNTNSEEDITEYNNWYIIMYKESLTFGRPIKQRPAQQPIEKRDEQRPAQQPIEQRVEEENSLKMNIRGEYDKLKSSGNKMTLVDLKKMLKTCNLKTSGKKDELVKRLEEFLY